MPKKINWKYGVAIYDAALSLSLAESLHTKGDGRCDNNLTNLWRRLLSEVFKEKQRATEAMYGGARMALDPNPIFRASLHDLAKHVLRVEALSKKEAFIKRRIHIRETEYQTIYNLRFFPIGG